MGFTAVFCCRQHTQPGPHVAGIRALLLAQFMCVWGSVSCTKCCHVVVVVLGSGGDATLCMPTVACPAFLLPSLLVMSVLRDNMCCLLSSCLPFLCFCAAPCCFRYCCCKPLLWSNTPRCCVPTFLSASCPFGIAAAGTSSLLMPTRQAHASRNLLASQACLFGPGTHHAAAVAFCQAGLTAARPRWWVLLQISGSRACLLRAAA